MFNRGIKKTLFWALSSIIVLLLLLSLYYFWNLHKSNQSYISRYATHDGVGLRKLPYPYRAAVAISNDVDGTGTLDEFIEINKFLNTNEQTSMGKGLGLNTGGSFFFYSRDSGTISYFSSDVRTAEIIREYIRNGYLDFLHSYGQESSFTREDAVRALRELKEHHLKIDVWIDHDHVVNNFGRDFMSGMGDVPSSGAYHADLTLPYGIKYASMGGLTMIVGQSSPIAIESFTLIYNSDHPIPSTMNILKVVAKNILANFGYKRYAIHRENDLVRVATLADGQKIFEFIRFNDNWGGITSGANSAGLAYQISQKNLDRLKETNGYMIAYTHLGHHEGCSQYICEETQDALRNLAGEYKSGNIYVSTTSGILNYYVVNKFLNWSCEVKNNQTMIHIHGIDNPVSGPYVPAIHELKGTTFYVPDSTDVRVFLNGHEIPEIQFNDYDFAGKKSVTVR